MKQITRGYKVGRNIKYYDVEDMISHQKAERVPKKELEEVIMQHPDEFSDYKWQEWQGKKILRILNNIEIVVETEDGQQTTVQSSAESKPVRATKAIDLKAHEDAMPKGRIVGRLGAKKKQQTKDFVLSLKESGYSQNNVYEQRTLRSSINHSAFRTLGDLFNQMASEFGLANVQKYRTMVENSKSKINLNTEMSRMTTAQIVQYQDFFAVFMMNMANQQINEAYSKYRAEYVSASVE